MKVKALIVVLIISLGVNAGMMTTIVYHRQFAYRKRFEERGPFGHEWRHSPLRDRLRLSEGQIDAMEAIREKSWSKTASIRQALSAKRRELMNLLKGPEPHRSDLDALLKEIASLQTELETQVFEDLLQTRDVLTPEQEKRFLTLLEGIRPGPGGIPPPP